MHTTPTILLLAALTAGGCQSTDTASSPDPNDAIESTSPPHGDGGANPVPEIEPVLPGDASEVVKDG